jgi:serine/threonine-protein kinase
MTLSPSRSADAYDFLGIIDKPKTGVTYKVRNRTTGELETLRALPGASASDPESRDRFLREIRVHTRLAHPNIAAFHDAFELDGQLVMTAEYVEGSTLTQLCAQGPFPIPEAVRIVSHVLSALEEAHALGIVHRAITADHVRVTASGNVKLDGFGLAKPTSDLNLTQTGVMLGDPRYISPEQVMGVQPLDRRADLYSVAILLYFALTGHVPFDGPHDFDVMVEQVRSIPRAPSHHNPAISPELDQLILKMLAKDPEIRLPRAQVFREALAALNIQPASLPPIPFTLPLAEPPSYNLTQPVIIFGTISLTIILTVILYVTLH